MKKAIIIVTFILLIGLLVFRMSLGNGILQGGNANYKSIFTELPSNQLEMENETDGYSVEKQRNGIYQCNFYGNDHIILRSEESSRIPHIEVLPSGYIKYVVQAGTGVGTLWGFFFDRDKEIFQKTLLQFWIRRIVSLHLVLQEESLSGAFLTIPTAKK